MNLRETDQERRFRSEAREWLADNLPDGWVKNRMREPLDPDARVAFRHAWHRKLHAGGWVGLTWPVEYGGRGLGLTHQLIFNEELVRAEAPQIASWVGLDLLGPTLIVYGSDEQKRRFLPSILNGEHQWCQGFSEPDAGSDLFAISTTAVETGAGWRISGRKKWTSWAQYSQYCLLLARTGDPKARHKSLSTLIVPMNAPGLTVVPTRMVDGESEENELILDGVEVGADALVGRRDGGAEVIITNMSFARGIGTIERTLWLERSLQRLWRTVEVLSLRGGSTYTWERARRQLVNLNASVQALKYLGYRKVSEMEETGEPGGKASVEKLAWAEIGQAVTRLAMEVLGAHALVEDADLDDGTWPGQWLKEYFRSKGGAVEGGTDEIQKDTIAKRVLARPRLTALEQSVQLS
ncbi:MAG: acyl-CoA dehydrogenase family protein [Pseudomonadota bacterium]